MSHTLAITHRRSPEGQKLDYWNNTRGFGDEEKALNYTSTYDIDGDGVSDGHLHNGDSVTARTMAIIARVSMGSVADEWVIHRFY